MTRLTHRLSLGLAVAGLVASSAAQAQVGSTTSVRTPADAQTYSAATRLARLPDPSNRGLADAMHERAARSRDDAVRDRARRVAVLIEAGRCDAAIDLAAREGDEGMANRTRAHCFGT